MSRARIGKAAALSLAGAACLARLAIAQTVKCPYGPAGYESETAGGQAIVQGSGSCIDGRPKTTYYSPSGAFSLDGSEFLLYVQGDDDICSVQPPPAWDRVFLLRHPNTWAGLTTPFDVASKHEVLPGNSGADPNYFYGGPNVFVDAGTYYMTASKSCGAANFNEILIGCSTNGSDWTWRTLFTTPHGVNVSAATLRYSPLRRQHYWWGFVELSPGQPVSAVFDGLCPDCTKTGTCRTEYSGLGAIRVHLTSHAPSNCANPTWDRVDILANGSWVSVPAGGHFDFGPPPKVMPSYVSFDEVNPKLTWVVDHWELWSTAVCDNNPGCGVCNSTLPENIQAGFRYRTVASFQTSLPPNPPELFSTIRCLPGSYPSSRWMPFRVEGTNLLYSATKDAVCHLNGDGQYVVVTGLTP